MGGHVTSRNQSTPPNNKEAEERDPGNEVAKTQLLQVYRHNVFDTEITGEDSIVKILNRQIRARFGGLYIQTNCFFE